MAEEKSYIQVDGVTFHYGLAKPVLRDLSARFDRSSTTIVAGANGAGKSTFLKLLLGLMRPQRGTIHVADKLVNETPLHMLAHHVAVSLQTAEHHIFSSTVRKEVSFGPTNVARPNADELVAEALQLFSLTEYSERHPYDLHAARRKLVSLASAVAMDTPFLIFDEPTVGLSRPEKEIFSGVLGLLRQKGKGYILITHDTALGFSHCDRILILHEGRFVVDASVSNFLVRPDAQAALKEANVSMPPSSRLSRLFDQRPVATTTRDLVAFLKEKTYDH
jgi:energy-coupling factor transporter ATP-binding protein EcfA2